MTCNYYLDTVILGIFKIRRGHITYYDHMKMEVIAYKIYA